MGDRKRKDVLIVGAGVTGLTTAVVLAEAGHTVSVIAAQPPHLTTSAMAGASWGPYLVGHDKVMAWSVISREIFTELAGEYGSGVHITSGVEAYVNMPRIPRWATDVPGFTLCRPGEFPDGYDGAWRYAIPLIEMAVYLRYLQDRLRRRGITVEVVEPLRDFDGVGETADVVVNCTGLGSRDLLGDDRLIPSRGQLTVVENPGITEFFQDNVDSEELTCIFPHGGTVYLGGLTRPHDVRVEFDPDLELRMIERCCAVDPRLVGAPIVRRLVGLRPQRDEIRVEIDPDDPRMIHNYGHGGSGVTLSWGCAQEVLALTRQ